MRKEHLMMKKPTSIASVWMIACLLFFYACDNNHTSTVISGDWVRFSDFGGTARSGAFQFTIGDTTYVGLGYGGINGNQYLLDSYSFNLKTNVWKTIAVFPGKGRELMFSFSLNGKGYVGTGFNRFETDADSVAYNDFWEFDPIANKWTQLGDFPGKGRYSAVAFSSEATGFGYAGAGYSGNYYSDFYKYNPDNDTWTGITAPANASGRRGASVMSLSGKFYYFGGESDGVDNTDFFEFDPATEKWTSLTKASTDPNFGDYAAAVKRAYLSTLTMTLDGKPFGYAVCGSYGGSPTTIVYQYDPLADHWTKMTSFEGGSRYQGISFVLTDATGTRGFVGMGTNGTMKLDDIWEWKPSQPYQP